MITKAMIPFCYVQQTHACIFAQNNGRYSTCIQKRVRAVEEGTLTFQLLISNLNQVLKDILVSQLNYL